MLETLFIADLHLDSRKPKTIKLFIDFLRNRAIKAENLYILGDLFEVWLGDDDDNSDYILIKQELYKLSQIINIFIMAGNRDFLIGNDFSKETGTKLLTEPKVINLYGIPTLLLHGDTLCTTDIEYQKFRSFIRNPIWQKQFLAKSLIERKIIAQNLRQQSQEYNNIKDNNIMDVTTEAVYDVIIEYNVSQIIHGHIHKQAIHKFNFNNKENTRIIFRKLGK
jgi:UDP-2,3-diacylglucosamine hydrolase